MKKMCQTLNSKSDSNGDVMDEEGNIVKGKEKEKEKEEKEKLERPNPYFRVYPSLFRSW